MSIKRLTSLKSTAIIRVFYNPDLICTIDHIVLDSSRLDGSTSGYVISSRLWVTSIKTCSKAKQKKPGIAKLVLESTQESRCVIAHAYGHRCHRYGQFRLNLSTLSPLISMRSNARRIQKMSKIQVIDKETLFFFFQSNIYLIFQHF